MEISGLDEGLVSRKGVALMESGDVALTAKSAIGIALENYRDPNQDQLTRAVDIADKIEESNGSCELASEDITIIKAACAAAYPAGVFVLIRDLVEGKSKE